MDNEETVIETVIPPETTPPEEKPRKKIRIFSLLCKIAFCLIAIFLVVITVMANIGGNGDALKQSIEEFIVEGTGYTAHVGKLNSMTFFPDIAFDFDQTELTDPKTGSPVAYIDKFQAGFSFWDVMATTGKIKVLNIQGVTALPGVMFKEKFMIERLAIIDTADDGPHLEGTGSIGGQPFKITAGMESKGLGQAKKYTFGKQRDFDFTLGDLNIKGVARAGATAGVVFDNLEATTGDKKIMTGAINLVRNGHRIDVTGNLLMADHQTDLAPAVELDMTEQNILVSVNGVFTSKEFHMDDFAANSSYDHMMSSIEKAFGAPPTPENIDFALDTMKLYKGSQDKGPYKGTLPLKGLRIDAASLGE